jgi:ferrochelatase
MKQSKKIGVLITNLGTPDSPTKKDLKKYLKEFLSDKRVVNPTFPRWIWLIILNVIILNIRPKKSAKAYKEVWGKFGTGSPLLDISLKQKELIQAKLGENYQVELGMRYGNPSIKNALNNLEGCEKIIVLPLYPQYSGSTTGSTFDEVSDVLRKFKVIPEIKFIDNYVENPSYIKALAESVKEKFNQNTNDDFLLVSYHGIPQRYADEGDIYPKHCEKTTKLLVQELGLKDSQYKMSYQSIFGREKWLTPYTEATLKDLAKNGVKNIKVICPGFSADCLETIEEIDMENREYFMEAGGEKYEYIPALNYNEEHINCLVDVLINK